MDAYIYQAALLCGVCGWAKRAELRATLPCMVPDDESDESSYDSDDYPKGPYPDGGGESDQPEYCGECGVFLKNPLTSAGEEYVREVLHSPYTMGPLLNRMKVQWQEFYGLKDGEES